MPPWPVSGRPGLWRALSDFRRAGEIWKVAYPLVIVNASHTAMQFTDRKLLSMSSTADMAAALPAGILCFTLFSLFAVTVNFTAMIVSQFHGRREARACARAPWAGVYFSLAAGLLCSYVLAPLGAALLDASGHPPDILARERGYFGALMPSGGFACLVGAFCSFYSGLGRTWTVALLNFFGCGLNIALDCVLIFGKLGAPALGTAGAGLATTLATAATAVAAAFLFLSQRQGAYPTRREWLPNLPDIWRLASFGLPNGVQVLCDVGAFTVFIFLVGGISEAALAATTIAMSINMISFMPQMGISDATGIVVGRHVGARRLWLARRTAVMGLKISLCVLSPFAFLYLFFPDPLLTFFSPGGSGGEVFAETLRIGRAILGCAAAYLFADAVYFVLLGALRGAGDTRAPMLLVISLAWGVLVPGSYALIRWGGVGAVGVWIFITAYAFLLAFAILLRFRSGAWRRISMV